VQPFAAPTQTPYYSYAGSSTAGSDRAAYRVGLPAVRYLAASEARLQRSNSGDNLCDSPAAPKACSAPVSPRSLSTMTTTDSAMQRSGGTKRLFARLRQKSNQSRQSVR
jgi:hypothetical protein